MVTPGSAETKPAFATSTKLSGYLGRTNILGIPPASSYSFTSSSSLASFSRCFTSTTCLGNRYEDDRRRRPKPFESFSRKYQPEFDHVVRKIENFSRSEFISGVTNGQIIFLVFLLSIFFPVENKVNLFFLVVFMVVNMLQ